MCRYMKIYYLHINSVCHYFDKSITNEETCLTCADTATNYPTMESLDLVENFTYCLHLESGFYDVYSYDEIYKVVANLL